MQFNVEEPKEVRIYIGGRIKEPGAYVGKFDRVYEHQSESGAVGLWFEFLSDKGESCRWYLNTIKRDGSNNDIGYSEIQSQIMPLLGLKSLREKQNDTMSFWDYDIKAEVNRRVTSFPQLMNKEIGVFFKSEQNEYNGKVNIQFRPDFYFDPKTKQTAEEKHNNKPANVIVLKLDKLNNTPAYTKNVEKKAESQPPTKTHNPETKDNFSYDDFEDDIPF